MHDDGQQLNALLGAQEYFLVALSQPRADKDELFVAPSDESKTSNRSATDMAMVRLPDMHCGAHSD